MPLLTRAGNEFQNGADRRATWWEHKNQSFYVNRFPSSEDLPRNNCVIGIVSVFDQSLFFIWLQRLLRVEVIEVVSIFDTETM